MSSESIRRPSISKRQARTLGKLRCKLAYVDDDIQGEIGVKTYSVSGPSMSLG